MAPPPSDQLSGLADSLWSYAAFTNVALHSFDEGGRPIEQLASLYRPDQYELRLALSRDGLGSPNLWRYDRHAAGPLESPAPAG